MEEKGFCQQRQARTTDMNTADGWMARQTTNALLGDGGAAVWPDWRAFFAKASFAKRGRPLGRQRHFSDG